jgi:subtilisin-like proprotein convertase family protein
MPNSTLRPERLCRFAVSVLASLGLIATAAAGKVSVTQDNGVTVTHVQVEGVKTGTIAVEGTNFTALSLQGVSGYEAIDYQVGRPQIPVVRFFVEGEPVITYSAAKAGPAIESGLKIQPNQPSRVKRPDEKTALVLDKEFYNRKQTKNVPFKISAAGSVNGVQHYLVTLYPVQYDPAGNSWSLISDFKVTVRQVAKKSAQEGTGDKEIFAFVVGAKFHNNQALLDYAALKEKLGYAVEFINVTASDTPETIRAALQAVYNRTGSTLKYALIIGDAEDVPGHESGIIAGVTDHYYRAIDTNDYATDINGPDIGVGRVSVATPAQLEVVLAKFTRYTNGQFAAEDWLNEIAFIATNDRWEVAEGSHNYAIQTHTGPNRYTGIFPQPVTDGGDQLYAITHRVSDAKVVEVMSMGRTIINYSGHGSTDSWAGPNISQDNVRSLTDPDALPFVISNACITGDFRVAESFGETWQRHHAGAVMFWGSMDSTYWDEDDILERAMYDGIYRDGRLQFHDITTHALSEHWRHYGGEGKAKYYWETYVTFGDPSLELRTSATREINIDGPEVLPVGVGTVTYKVTANGQPAAGVRVALTVPGRPLTYAGVSDASGDVTLNISAATREVVTFNVAAYGKNARLSSRELQIIPADNPYLAVSDFEINGRTGNELYLNETFQLGARLTNLGQRPSTGADLQVVSVEGPATMISGTARIPAMAARAVYRLTGEGLRFSVHENANAGDIVRINLKWTTDEGQTADVPVTLRILKAGIEITGMDFGTDGTVGGIAPGTNGIVFATVRNTGNETIQSGSLSVQAGACVDTVTGELPLENLTPGASVRIETGLNVGIAASCRNGDAVGLTFAGSYTSAATTVALAGEAKFIAGIVATAERVSENIGLAIPDNGPAAEHVLNVDIDGVIKDIGVHLKVTHPYVGDLSVKLQHPDGTTVVLHNREGGDADNIDHVYGLDGDAVADLQNLAGKSAGGAWKVIVQDHAGSDEGTLEYVALKIRGYLN